MPQTDDTSERPYLSYDFPLHYADGILSHYYTDAISKIYFGRMDPDPNAKSQPRTQAVAQVVLPTAGFVDLCLFLEQRLETMIEAGVVDGEVVKRMRQEQSEKAQK